MDSIFIDAIQEARKLENYTVSGDTTENNLETTYRFLSEGKGTFFTSSLGLSSRPTSLNYTPHAIEIVYNRNVLSKMCIRDRVHSPSFISPPCSQVLRQDCTSDQGWSPGP